MNAPLTVVSPKMILALRKSARQKLKSALLALVSKNYITIRHGFVCLFVCKEGAALLALVSSNALCGVSSFTSAYMP